MVDHDKAFAFTAPYEGCVPHFYLDPYGIVTWGYGNAGPLSSALKLAWTIDGAPAENTRVTVDYATVKGAQRGFVADWYKRLTKCSLSQRAARVLFNDRVDEFNIQLAGIFPGFDTLPAGCQLALMDEIFNEGGGTLVHVFATHVAAVRARDWNGAAASCHRRNPNVGIAAWDPTDRHEQRQIACRDLFLAAV